MELKQVIEDYLPSRQSKVCLGITLALAVVPFLLPESVISEIQMPPKAQLWLLKATISLGLLLIGACVILSIEIHSRIREKAAPENSRVFDPENGVWRDPKTGLCYCAKCRATPLRVTETGWYCITCNMHQPSAEQLKKVAEERKREDEMVRAYNRNNRI